MPQPLQDGQVTYSDRRAGDAAPACQGVTAFMMWAAEPHMEARKRIGMQVMIFLLVLTGLLYFTKEEGVGGGDALEGVSLCS